MSTLRSVALLVSAVGLVSGCALIAAPDEAFLLGDGGAGGGTSSTGGAGGGPECTSPTDCTTINECEQSTCEGGVCRTEPRPAGTAVADPTAGDCQASECDGEGNAASVVDDTDLPDDLADCTDDVCMAGVPTNPNEPANTACGVGGALFCDGSGSCVGCTAAAQCAAGDACRTPICAAGVCDFLFTAAGALPTGQQTDGDCQTAGCDGAGVITSTNDDIDLPDDGNSCTQDLCTGNPSAPSNPNEPTTTSCGTNLLCNGMGVCVGCNVPADCGTDTICQSFTCTAGVCGTVDANMGTACTDGTFCNGAETCNGSGVCGNSAGDPCAPDGDDDCMDACNEAADSCTANSLAGAACPNASFCDGAETCDGSGACSDNADPCSGHDVGPACNDSCNEQAGNCTASDAAATPCPNGTFCDGAETCNGSGACSDNVDPCAGHNVGPACNDSCNEAADDCTASDLAATPCPNGTFCDGAETCNGSGACSDNVDPCLPDGDADCQDACNEAADNCTAPSAAGAACPNANFCDGAETCTGSGACSDNADPCLPDGDADCQDACNEAADNCTANSLVGATCPNANFCDGAETCNGAGVCSDNVDPCLPDGDGDCADACNETADDCTAASAVTAACTDGLHCTGTETCNGVGSCGGSTGNPCPGQDTGANCNDSCDESADNCTAADLVTCGDTFVCGAEFCDDGNVTACGFCNATCTDAGTGGELCGDGALCSDLFTETCDDFNFDACGSCNATCDGAGSGTCATGTGCAVDADCTSNLCLGNVCVETCAITGTALLAWSLDLPSGADWDTEAQVPYTIDNRGALTGTPFTRVAYCLQLDATWVYAEMDDFTGGVVLTTGIPADFTFETGVANITLRTNSPDVTPVTNATGGLIELWPNCYAVGLNGLYDYDDSIDPSTDCYGSFQVHHNTTTALAVSRWSGGGFLDLGIGNQIGGSGHPDWTFRENGGSFSVKRLQGFIVP